MLIFFSKMTSQNIKSWKEGYWYGNKNKHFLTHVNVSGKAEFINLICIDYAKMPTLLNGTWKIGNYGIAVEKIIETTGIHNYNLEMSMGPIKLYGVINEAGDQIHFLGIR